MTFARNVLAFGMALMLADATAFAADEDEVLVKSAGRRGWRVSGGLMSRTLDNVSIRGGSRMNQSMLPQAASSSFAGSFSRFGDEAAIADRSYDDGYVRQDPGTTLDGDTWYWGYQNSSQIQGDRLVFHGLAGQQTTSSQSIQMTGGQAVDEDDSGVGLYIKALREIDQTDRFSLNLLVSGSYTPFSVGVRSSTFNAQQRSVTYDVTVVDTYDLLGVTPHPAPYSGTYTGPGTLLPNIPENRDIQQAEVSRSDTRYFNDVRSELDISVTSFCLGLQGEWGADLIQLTSAAGASVNFVSVDGARTELVYRGEGGSASRMGRFADQDDEYDIALGTFIQAGVRFALSDRIGVEFCGQYDLVDPIQGGVGPASYKIDLDGLSMMAMLCFQL